MDFGQKGEPKFVWVGFGQMEELRFIRGLPKNEEWKNLKIRQWASKEQKTQRFVGWASKEQKTQRFVRHPMVPSALGF
ncbi:unnamed protein product [Rhizophagus irregularis]|nr:unnamed protein product [Rhizophagus irregularis]